MSRFTPRFVGNFATSQNCFGRITSLIAIALLSTLASTSYGDDMLSPTNGEDVGAISFPVNFYGYTDPGLTVYVDFLNSDGVWETIATTTSRTGYRSGYWSVSVVVPADAWHSIGVLGVAAEVRAVGYKGRIRYFSSEATIIGSSY